MTPNDHRAALFDALRQCEFTWAKSQTHPSAEAGSAHDAALAQFNAALNALEVELKQARDQIERLSLDLHALDRGMKAVSLMGEQK